MTKIISDISLDQSATGGQTGTVCEPSFAVSGKRLMVTGNWFASRSIDKGANWAFIDPYTELPPTGAGVCCDQLVLYSKKWRLWIWLLQFVKSSTGNIVRVAVSASGKSGTWTWWDTAPSDIDPTWKNVWFDYPDMVETGKHLLLSFNLYTVSNDSWQRAVVLRLPLQALKARQGLSRQAWSTDQAGSLRFARGATDRAIFASHSPTSAGLMIFKWLDSESVVTASTVAVTDWSDGPYHAAGPGGAPWLSRLDDRITGGWQAGGALGFAWSAAADGQHPYPYIRVARIDEQSETLIDEPDLWSEDFAWAYPATAPNRRGDVGMAAFFGGATHHPAHAVGWFDEKSGAWRMATGGVSTHGPRDGMWGDYLDIQPDPTRKTYWMASGYVLSGGSTRTSIRPRVVTFKP